MDLKRKTIGGGDGQMQLTYAKDISSNNQSASGKKKAQVPVVVPAALPLFGHQKDTPHEHSAAAVLEFLNSVRGLNNVTILRYGVGMANEMFLNDAGEWEDQLCVTFPWMKVKERKSVSTNEDLPMEIIRLKYRSAQLYSTK